MAANTHSLTAALPIDWPSELLRHGRWLRGVLLARSRDMLARSLPDAAMVPQRIKGPNGEDIQIFVQPGKQHMFWQPGVPLAVPQAFAPQAVVAPRAPLPNGVSISISRTNNDPAKISIKRGSESWEITDRELNKLPADLRPHVEAMLNPQRGVVQFVPPPQPVKANPRAVRVPPEAKPGADESVKKADVDKLRQQLEELSRKLDQLNEKNK